MKFYTQNNSTPAPLSFRITMPDGSTRTDPSSFTDEEIAAAGYVEVPAPPGYNSATQHPPEWDGTSWTVRDLTEQEILARLPRFYETEGGIRLGIEDEDQNAFSRLLNLINLSEFTDSTEIEIKDIYFEMHTVTVLEFKEIMKLYGLHCYRVFKG